MILGTAGYFLSEHGSVGPPRRDESTERPRSACQESQTPTKPTSIRRGETGSRLEFRSGGEAYPLRRSRGDGDDDAEVVVAHSRSGSTRSPRQDFPFLPNLGKEQTLESAWKLGVLNTPVVSYSGCNKLEIPSLGEQRMHVQGILDGLTFNAS